MNRPDLPPHAPHPGASPPSAASWQLRLEQKRVLIGILALALVFTFHYFSSLLLPILLALLLSFLLLPIVNQLNRLRIPDPLASLMVVLAIVALTGVGVFQLAEPATDWLNRGPAAFRKLEWKLSSVLETVREARKASQQIEKIADPAADASQQKVVVSGPSLSDQFTAGAKGALLNFGVILVFIYFILAYGRTILRRFAYFDLQQNAASILFQVQREISIYLATIAIINVLLGVATAGVMALLGMPNPVLWGVVAALMNFIPYVGPGVTLFVLAVISVLTFEDVYRIVLPPACFLAMTTLEGQLLTPIFLGKRLTLNPLVVFLSMFFWGWMWSYPGIVLAMPILSTIKIVSENVPGLSELRRILE
jgi:predicted PurR-regulated permease PerM